MLQEAEPAAARAGGAEAQQGTQSFAAEMRAKAEAKRKAVVPEAAPVRLSLS